MSSIFSSLTIFAFFLSSAYNHYSLNRKYLFFSRLIKGPAKCAWYNTDFFSLYGTSKWACCYACSYRYSKKVLFIDILFSFVIRVFLYSCEGVNLTSLYWYEVNWNSFYNLSISSIFSTIGKYILNHIWLSLKKFIISWYHYL